jgi:hypothetical protein
MLLEDAAEVRFVFVAAALRYLFGAHIGRREQAAGQFYALGNNTLQRRLLAVLLEDVHKVETAYFAVLANIIDVVDRGVVFVNEIAGYSEKIVLREMQRVVEV